MTGKAHALGNEVNFESGILRSHEIDGFGQTVKIDKPNNNNTVKIDSEQLSADLVRLESKVDLLATSIAEFKEQGQINVQSKINATGTGEEPVCPSGYEPKQKFAMRGPEGWRVLDQDERLVLAMSSSAKPLVTSLRTLANLRGKSQVATGTALIEEENRVLEILLKLQDETAVPPGETPVKAVELLNSQPEDPKKVKDSGPKAPGSGQLDAPPPASAPVIPVIPVDPTPLVPPEG
jgi:hypothetical protein